MAALDISCLTGVLGLANCECPCLTETAPEGYGTSSSGLYLADLVPLSLVGESDKCSDPSNPWNMMDRARTQGANMVLNDVRSGIMKRNQHTRQKFTGMIGEKAARDTRSLSSTYAGVRISPPRIRGGYMKLTSIGGIFNASGTVSVRFYDRFNTAVGSAVSITTVAGQHASASCDISLPMWAEGANVAEYFAVYTVNQNNLPRDNRLFCPSCNNRNLPVFSKESPYYLDGKWSGVAAWANWTMVSGWEGDSLTEFDLEAEVATGEHFMNGLTLTAEFVCDPASSICLGGLDYSDPVALSLAHAYRYAAAITLAQMIGRSPEVLRNANIAKEVLAADVQNWWKDYQANVEFVTYHAPVNNTDCVFCKPAFAMSVQSKLP